MVAWLGLYIFGVVFAGLICYDDYKCAPKFHQEDNFWFYLFGGILMSVFWPLVVLIVFGALLIAVLTEDYK